MTDNWDPKHRSILINHAFVQITERQTVARKWCSPVNILPSWHNQKITLKDLSKMEQKVTHIWEEEKELEQQESKPCFTPKSPKHSGSSRERRQAMHHGQVTALPAVTNSLQVPAHRPLTSVWKICCKHGEGSEERKRNTEQEEAGLTTQRGHSTAPFQY